MRLSPAGPGSESRPGRHFSLLYFQILNPLFPSQLPLHKRFIGLTANKISDWYGKKAEIPCASSNAPHLNSEAMKLRVRLPECANQYVV
jgi:hypothetical protein